MPQQDWRDLQAFIDKQAVATAEAKGAVATAEAKGDPSSPGLKSGGGGGLRDRFSRLLAGLVSSDKERQRSEVAPSAAASSAGAAAAATAAVATADSGSKSEFSLVECIERSAQARAEERYNAPFDDLSRWLLRKRHKDLNAELSSLDWLLSAGRIEFEDKASMLKVQWVWGGGCVVWDDE
jgi:hypothetical protein